MKKITLLMLALMLGVSYGTRAQWVCGQDITDGRDSKVYKTVLIGTQCWMAENMNYGTLINSTKAGSEMSDNGVVEKYCWHDSVGNCDGTGGVMKRGGFYEWQEAMQFYGGQPSLPVQGICPAGWHIPSNAEWNTLTNGLGATAYQKMLKGGTSGFEALLTGYRCTMTGGFRTSAIYDPTEWRGYYWTAEQTDADNAPFLEIAATQLTAMSFYKSVGLSVRCIKNATSSIYDLENQGYEIHQINYTYDHNLIVEFDAIRSSSLSYCILNMDGRILHTGELLAITGKNSLQVNFVELAAGIYIFRMNNQYTVINKKFIVK